ncbi:MAG: PLDc_N domain-containing protein [Sphingobacteriales bacterium]|nr:MAG: PLDc_N domain-containing protein [Sphingobacteriales bacterium]
MSTSISAFMNMGTGEIGILLAVALLPAILTLYSVIDIFRSQFKQPNSKLLFLILVIVAPMIGSLVYLLLRRDYKLPSKSDHKMPY